MPTYDLIVIGTGPGGYVCAIRAAQLGMKTAVVEKRRHVRRHLPQRRLHPLEGDAACLGALRGGRHTASRQMGIKVGKPSVDLAALLKYKDGNVESNVKGVDFLFKKNKIEAFRGAGRIAAPGKVEVKAADGKTQTLETKNIVIATGSDVARLHGIDIDEKRIVSSTGALDLAKVPQKLLVVGAGIIGMELGSVWRRLGAEVTVVEFLDHILPGIDSEIARQFQRIQQQPGHRLQAVVEGHRRRHVRQDAEGEGRAGRGRRARRRSRPMSSWSRSAACRTPRASASKPPA